MNKDPTYTEYVTANARRTARAIRALGLTATLSRGAWRIAPRIADMPAYYTTDNTDALNIAHAMAAALRNR